MPLFTWNDDFSVQIEEIDQQHKRLVAMINDLHEAMIQRTAKEAVEDIIRNLAAYTVEHFTLEEKYFEKFEYIETGIHKAQHKIFVDQVAQFKSDFESGKLMLSMEVMNFLKDWLTGHIQNTDKRYTQCFLDNGLASS